MRTRFSNAWAADRKAGIAPFLEPDAKSQVTLRYANERPVEATAIVVSTQHAPGAISYHSGEGDEAKYQELRKYVLGVIADVLPAELLTANTVYHINPTGRFEIGGPRRRRRPDRPQDHRRHRMAARAPHGGGGVQRQGPDQGRPLGGLCHALPRQEYRRRGPCPPLHDPAQLRDRRRRAAVGLCRSARHRGGRRDRGGASSSCCRSSSA